MRITADIIEDESQPKQFSENLSEYSLSASQKQAVQAVTERLRDLNLSDMIPNPSHQMNFSSVVASGPSKETMEDSSESVTEENAPPPWLQSYMAKMKKEIKKEIINELLLVNMTPEPRQGQICLQHLNNLAEKEETQFQDQGEVIHSGIYCDNCDQLIHGIRYKCGNCSDFDLCQECESLSNVHNKNHIFLKIRYPFALKLYQRQKWQELMSPLPVKPPRFNESSFARSQSKKLYEAKFLCDETVPDSTIIPPSTRFVKSWKVMNSGTRVWTHATKLDLIQGSPDLVPISQKVDVPHLKPGEEGIVSVLFTSPPLPGVYRSHWNFCHKSRPFGHIVWCHIIVKEKSEESITKEQDAAELSDKIVNKQVEVANIDQALTVVKEEQEDNVMVHRKLIVNSYTATPNNTPFALTPPKSPDHETLTKTVLEMASKQNDSDNEDDMGSVISVCSSDSDTEFVVIPMPKCFDLSEDFIAHQLHLKENLMKSAEMTTTLNSEEVEMLPVKSVTKKSTPVSQETGVPESSECHPIYSALENSACYENTKISETASKSSSEISIIDSENNSPTVIENATQTFDSISVTVSTSTSTTGELENVEVQLVDVPNICVEATTNTETIDNQEESNIPGNATFPKFPIEGITEEMLERPSFNNVNTEERTIQVLPEGLVIGALSAAASVYNTAKAVINTMQQPPKAETVTGLSQPLPRIQPVQQPTLSANRQETLNPMDQLIEMGFCNRQKNETLLKKHNNDVALVVAELVSMSDNDWYDSRHIPSSHGLL